jgi:hypothetical protein
MLDAFKEHAPLDISFDRRIVHHRVNFFEF